ncbi:hypothetical protein ACOSOMT5_P2551 [Acidiphilium sp. MT5]
MVYNSILLMIQVSRNHACVARSERFYERSYERSGIVGGHAEETNVELALLRLIENPHDGACAEEAHGASARDVISALNVHVRCPTGIGVLATVNAGFKRPP